MRKVKLLNSQNVDVLIVDEMGTELIKYCIPDSASFSILPVRNVVPLIMSFNFLLRILIRIIKLKKIKDAVLFSIVDVLKPTVLITYTDTSNLMGKLHDEFPNKLTIAIQNGLRRGVEDMVNNIFGTFDKYPVSVLYGFGEFEKRLLKSGGVNVVEYVPAGSLKYGIFKKQIIINSDKKYDICLISEYEVQDNPCAVSLMEETGQIFLCLTKICKEFGFSLAVLNEK